MATPSIHLALRVSQIELLRVELLQIIGALVHAADRDEERVPDFVVIGVDDAVVGAFSGAVPCRVFNTVDMRSL